MIINVNGLDIKLTKGQLKQLELYSKSRDELVESFKKQLKYTLSHFRYICNVNIKDNIIYIMVNGDISENRFFDERVEYIAYFLSKIINRNVVYTGRYKSSLIRGTEIIFRVKEDDIKLNDKIETLNDYVLTNPFTKINDLYEKNNLIITFVKTLIDGQIIPDFKLHDNKVYYKDSLLIIINYFNGVYKKSQYHNGEDFGYDFHMYLKENTIDIIYIILDSYKSTHTNKIFQYTSKGNESRSWLVEDIVTGVKEDYKNWSLYLS